MREPLKNWSGADIYDIPYKIVAQMTQGILSRDVQMVVDSAAAYRSLAESKKAHAVAVAASTRDPVLPDVPTTAELGIPIVSPGFSGGFWAPTGTPPQLIQTLSEAVAEIMQMPEVIDALKQSGAQATFSTPAEFGTMVRAERET